MTTTLPYSRYTELLNKEADYEVLKKKLKDAHEYADKLMDENTQLNSAIEESIKEKNKLTTMLQSIRTECQDLNREINRLKKRNESPKVELKPDQIQTAEVVDAKMQTILDYVNKQVTAISGAIAQGMRASNALREMIKIADLEIDTLYKKTGHEKPTGMPMEEGNPLHMLFAMLGKTSMNDIDN